MNQPPNQPGTHASPRQVATPRSAPRPTCLTALMMKPGMLRTWLKSLLPSISRACSETGGGRCVKASMHRSSRSWRPKPYSSIRDSRRLATCGVAGQDNQEVSVLSSTLLGVLASLQW